MVQCHAGAYGGCNSHGDPICKVYQWLTNSSELATALSRKLSAEEQMYCVPLQGKEVRLSARYPEKMCRAMLRALKVEARRRWPQRFMQAHEVFYEEPTQDPAAWMDVLRQVHTIFEKTAVRSSTSRTRTLCATRSPAWCHGRVTRTPAQRHLPRDILFRHCGAVLEYQDGHIAVEAEALAGMHFPKQKFTQAVAYGAFWYGYGDPKASPPEEQPTASSTIEMVTFPGIPNDVPTEIKAAIRRLHLNLGHPSEKELLRLLAYQGAISKSMITAVKHLHCASCVRTKPAKHPRPATIPKANMGQFNDSLQTDVFYCRDVAGANHAGLGIIDQSTLFHKAARLEDMSSEGTLQLFRSVV